MPLTHAQKPSANLRLPYESDIGTLVFSQTLLIGRELIVGECVLHECCAMRWGAMHNTREKQRLMLQRANSVRAVERQESSLFSEVFLWFRM